jgi:hypothetical protein
MYLVFLSPNITITIKCWSIKIHMQKLWLKKKNAGSKREYMGTHNCMWCLPHTDAMTPATNTGYGARHTHILPLATHPKWRLPHSINPYVADVPSIP